MKLNEAKLWDIFGTNIDICSTFMHLHPAHRRQRRHLLLFIQHTEELMIVLDTWMLLLVEWLNCTKIRLSFLSFYFLSLLFLPFWHRERFSWLPKMLLVGKILSICLCFHITSNRFQKYGGLVKLEAPGDKPLRHHTSSTDWCITV